MFFSFDGLDGVGKTTQMTLFEGWLAERGYDVVHCVDPGTTPLGESVRALLLGHQVPISLEAEMLLFMAARAQLVDEVIAPAIERGKVVVSDRYLLANIVYQGYAGGLEVERVRDVGRIATRGVLPDMVFLLDMDPQDANRRITRQPDRMEMQDQAYKQRLRDGFLTEAKRDPQHIKVINATRSVDDVQAEIRSLAADVLTSGTRT